jgi:hypothetical protein
MVNFERHLIIQYSLARLGKQADFFDLLLLQHIHDVNHLFIAHIFIGRNDHGLICILFLFLFQNYVRALPVKRDVQPRPDCDLLIANVVSFLIMTSIGAIAAAEDLPILGRSICPGFNMGAVIMKMTSNTSITSI